MSLVNSVLCLFGWHTPDRWYKNAFRDGINRPHAWCKHCGKHVPLFGHRRHKRVSGVLRQKSLICVSDIYKHKVFERYN